MDPATTFALAFGVITSQGKTTEVDARTRNVRLWSIIGTPPENALAKAH
jgi:hypothetical protein